MAQLPTVWLAEGLLMYIDPPAVDALLREAAAASVKGSSFLAQVCQQFFAVCRQKAPLFHYSK